MYLQKEIINFELTKKHFSFYSKYKNTLENLFELFYFILKNHSQISGGNQLHYF